MSEPSNPSDFSDASTLSGQISSWRDFSDRVSAGMAMAASDPCEITLCDKDFAQWPLGSKAVVEAFKQWAVQVTGHKRCVLLAADYARFESTHPRWVQWRQHWTHRVICRQVEEDLASQVPTLFVLHGRLALRIIDPLMGRGLWTRDPKVLADWYQQSDVISQRSHEALGSKTLGL